MKDLFQAHSLVVDRSHFSWAAGLRASVPYWLLARGCSQFFDMYVALSNKAASSKPTRGRKGLLARWKPQSSVTKSQNSDIALILVIHPLNEGQLHCQYTVGVVGSKSGIWNLPWRKFWFFLRLKLMRNGYSSSW